MLRNIKQNEIDDTNSELRKILKNKEEEKTKRKSI